jgi:hydroxymethylbilane synthase
MSDRFVIGSRGSKLALTQAEWVTTRLAILHPGIDIHIEIVKTTGDVKTDPLSVIGGKGVFTKELEDALLDRRIDIAVHSLKDLPTIVPEALAIAAICEREDPLDALVLRKDSDSSYASLKDLPVRSIVGTSSPRRQAQLRHLRPELVMKDLRGNVDTRLRKLDEGQYDAVILASAGLRRLGLDGRISARLPTEQMLPAPGQGAIGVEIRTDDSAAMNVVTKLDHEATRVACTAERALLRALGGGCQLPIAAHAVIRDYKFRLDGLVASHDGRRIVRDHIAGSTEDAEKLGGDLANRLLELGAKELLAE